MWFILSILGAFFDATYYVLNKYFLRRINEYILGGGVFITSFFILIVVSLIKGIPGLNLTFLYAALITSVLNVIAIILYFKALKIGDISLVIPMTSFTPLFLIITSSVILGEFPSRIGILGIFLIVIGSYILNFKTFKTDKILEPFKNLFKEKATLYMIIVAFVFSISSNFDKLTVINSDPAFGMAFVCLLIGISFMVISYFKKQNFIQSYRTNFSKFTLVALVQALVLFTITGAYFKQIVPYVISIKRTSILFSVLYGFLLFKEKEISKRFLAALIMFVGVVLILLG